MICSKCVLDESVADLSLDEQGVCHICRYTERSLVKMVQEAQPLDIILHRLRGGRKYDAIIGLSGGVDSSYLAYLAVKKFKLKLLATSIYNGAETPEAQNNIQRLVDTLKLDFEPRQFEMRDIQLAYYRAGVRGLEIPIDHAIVVHYRLKAKEHGIHVALSGHNMATESHLPTAWTHSAFDSDNIVDICLKHGVKQSQLASMPVLTRQQVESLKVKEIRLLNQLPYNRDQAIENLKEVGWKPYGLKHWENIHTRFYQTYVLPRRWGIDKRKSHLSALVYSGQMARAEALRVLQEPPCSEELLQSDKRFILDWLGITEQEFDGYMNLPLVPHTAYRVSKPPRRYLKMAWKKVRKFAAH